MSQASIAFTSNAEISSLTTTQAVHTTEIVNIKDSLKRVEEKLEKLFYWILGVFGTAVIGIFVGLARR